jgi:LacI family transcriptional regulator
VPSQRGRSLATRSTGQIGIVVSDLGNYFYLEVLHELHEVLRSAGLRMLVLTPEADDSVSVEQLVDGSLDGVILTTTLLGSSVPQELASRGFPFVLLNREVDDCPGDVCVIDNVLGAQLVARELLALGHTQVAAIFGSEQTSTGRDRETGFRSVLDQAGVELPASRRRRCEFDFAAGHMAATELLDARRDHPTAIFAANDIIALGAFNAMRGRRIRIPDEITLIGFDDLRLAGWEVFRLTTVRQDIPGLVRAATELLLSRLAAGTGATLEPRRVVLAPTLVLRGTHSPARAKAG